MTICEQIGRWAAELRLEHVPERVLERARLQADNMDAARRAGEDAAAIVSAGAPAGRVGEIYLGAAASIAHDWDDYLFMGHPGHSSVWAARAFATDDPGRALIAQVAANEVAGRLGAALLLGPHNGQFWSTIHCASGAVAAGVGLGLDPERLASAVAISLYQPPYGLWPGFMGAETKLLTAAEPAAQGARAALLAEAGMKGPLDVVEDPRGLLTHFSFAPRASMLGALGSVWLTDTLAYKPHPGCAYLQAAVDAALAAEVAADDVASVDVEAGYLTCGMERLGAGREITPVRVNFSTALSVAVCLLAGRLTDAELNRRWLGEREGELREIASRVRVRHDWELTAATLRGAVDAGATAADLSLTDWLRVARRARESHMDEAAVGLGELLGLARDRRARGEIAAIVGRARAGDGSLRDLDTGALRLTFPCRLIVRLRSGRVLDVEGRERGSCGRSPEEQRAVVREKSRLAGVGQRES